MKETVFVQNVVQSLKNKILFSVLLSLGFVLILPNAFAEVEICESADDCHVVQEIIVNKVEFMQDEIYEGELGFYEVDVTDENGNPIEAYVTGRVEYQASWGPSSFSPVGNYDKEKKKFVGELTAPDEIAPGTYVLKLDVSGRFGGPLEFSGIKQVEFQIGQRPGDFDEIFSSISIEKMMGSNRFYDYTQPRFLELQLVKGHFYSPPLSNHPVALRVYGEDQDGNLELLNDTQVISDDNGQIRHELGLTNRDYCQYEIHIESQYQGFKQSHKIDFHMANTRGFDFEWQGEKIPIKVEGECSVPLDVDFSQPTKTMSVKVDTTDPRKAFEVHFPHKLLDGELTALVNGKDDATQYYIEKRLDEAIVRVNSVSNDTTVEIVGTTAIPEFQTLAIVVLLASIIPLVLFSRFSYHQLCS